MARPTALRALRQVIDSSAPDRRDKGKNSAGPLGGFILGHFFVVWPRTDTILQLLGFESPGFFGGRIIADRGRSILQGHFFSSFGAWVRTLAMILLPPFYLLEELLYAFPAVLEWPPVVAFLNTATPVFMFWFIALVALLREDHDVEDKRHVFKVFRRIFPVA